MTLSWEYQVEGVFLGIPRVRYFYSLVRKYVDSTIHTEVMTLDEGLLVTAALWWVSFPSFVFEFDSKSVIAWVADPLSAS